MNGDPPATLATRCVHAGAEPDPQYGAVVPPIHLATTFVQDDVAKPRVHDYSRAGNPTRNTLERALADLEGGASGHAFSSGLAALDALVHAACKAGDHIVCAQDAYGGTIRYLDQVASRKGITTTYVDTRDLDALAGAVQEGTGLVVLESPTNPLLRVTDLKGAARVCRDAGALLCVDNTFMSPALQNPLDLGAHVVLHSATKYIGGHSDVLAGALVAGDEGLGERLSFVQKAVGAVAAPFDCYLLLRGLRTLHLRMERSSHNAALLAQRLSGHDAVQAVHYPGLKDHPGHAVHAAQARSGGGMVSFSLQDAQAARRLVTSTRLFSLAESLGAVESLIQVPAAMTHASIPKETRQRTGITDGLVRLSVGVEDAEDLWRDLEAGLE